MRSSSSDEMAAAEIDKLMALASSNPKLQGAAKIIMVKTNASPYVERAINDPMLSDDAGGGSRPGLKSVHPRGAEEGRHVRPESGSRHEVRDRAGRVAQAAGDQPRTGAGHPAAKAALLAALNDARPDIVKLSGRRSRLINDKEPSRRCWPRHRMRRPRTM